MKNLRLCLHIDLMLRIKASTLFLIKIFTLDIIDSLAIGCQPHTDKQRRDKASLNANINDLLQSFFF
jgi:hypothetical protein